MTRKVTRATVRLPALTAVHTHLAVIAARGCERFLNIQFSVLSSSSISSRVLK